VTILPKECGQFVKLTNLLLGRVYVLQSIILLCSPRYDAWEGHPLHKHYRESVWRL